MRPRVSINKVPQRDHNSTYAASILIGGLQAFRLRRVQGDKGAPMGTDGRSADA